MAGPMAPHAPPLGCKGLMNSCKPLSANTDVRAVFATRAVRHGATMVVHRRRREDEGPCRCAVVAGRKVGNAVRRNRVKRRLRGALRHVEAAAGVDVVIVGRPAALTADFSALVADLRQLLDGAADPRGGPHAGKSSMDTPELLGRQV